MMRGSTSYVVKHTLQLRLAPVTSSRWCASGTCAGVSKHTPQHRNRTTNTIIYHHHPVLSQPLYFALQGGGSLLQLQQQTATVQHRHYSSVTDYIRQLMTVTAAEPASSDAAAETAAAAASTTQSVVDATTVDSSSTVSEQTLTDGVEYIPLPPDPLLGGVDPSTLTVLGEPSLASLGMAGWSPVWLLQQGVELLHVSGLPWWGSIALATIILRTLLFPLVVIAQRNATKLSNVSPQMQAIQMKMTEARQSGDQLQVSRYTQEMVKFMEEKNVNPIKSMLVPLAQAPVFISMFVGLRRCANLPVMSMATGGAYWFMDLTVADPYYILPILTSTTMFLTIELGTEVGRLQSAGENARIMFTVMRFMPLVAFPFMCNFPAAVLCYWLTTNLMSLGQAGLLKIPQVRSALNIPIMVKHPSSSLPMTQQQDKKSTLQAAKDSWKNLQVTREISDRQRYDEVRFAKAGSGPVVRTFKYDPTKATKKAPLVLKAKVKQ